MCDDLFKCMLEALGMLVMVTAVPLLLYLLWIGLPG